MDLSRYDAFLVRLREAGFGDWTDALQGALAHGLRSDSHGDLRRWEQAVSALPRVPCDRRSLSMPCVRVDAAEPVDPDLQRQIRELLLALHPWRKGPFCLHGVHIDAEWRSDRKWSRLEHAIAPLAGRRVLDVGCGNGYYCWRMAGAGAQLVLGIDPTVLYVMQFLAVDRFLQDASVGVLPLALEGLPVGMSGFDTVFSMGVLYHRRSPIDHLQALRGLLRRSGELVLETLVLDEAGDRVLVPPGRYARMQNLWFIPSPDALMAWLGRCGFHRSRVVDVTPTTPAEQRSTPWMRFQSLADFLDPEDPQRTVEGLPAPRRGIFIAEAR